MGASSSKVGSTERRDTTILRGLVGTAVEMKYPMWLVPVSAFVKLAKLEPHQVMRQRGELVMWEPSMKTVFFLSHRKWMRRGGAAAGAAVHTRERLAIHGLDPPYTHTISFHPTATMPLSLGPSEWTSFEHPDHTLEQMRCFKRLLIRMMKGEIANTMPDFAAQSYLPKGIKVTTKEWQAVVSDAFIWMDYMSVPQIGTYLDAGLSDLVKAVESIPAYGE
jgi:hypothetical protein